MSPTLGKVAASFNATRWQTFRKVLLPALAVPMITGLRLGLGLAIVGVLLAETKISNHGLGFVAIHYYSAFRIADLYALLIAIFACAGLINALLLKCESRIRVH